MTTCERLRVRVSEKPERVYQGLYNVESRHAIDQNRCSCRRAASPARAAAQAIAPLAMLWIKAFHIVFMVTWFAAVFYLPRLFVYHAMAEDNAGKERFKVMERKLLRGIMNPGAILTLLSGCWLWLGYGITGGWLYAKLVVVALLMMYHLWCIVVVRRFARDENRHKHVYYRWMNEVPVLFLITITILVVVKPF